MRQTFSELLQKTRLLAVSSLVNNLLNFFSGLVLAASLGPMNRGLYQQIKILISLGPSFLNLNFGNFITSNIELKRFNFRGLRIHLILAWFFFTIVTYFFSRNRIDLTIFFSVVVFFPNYFLSTFVQGLLIRNGKNKHIAIMNLISVGGTSICIIILYLADILTLNNCILCIGFNSLASLIWGLRHAKFSKGESSIYRCYRKYLPIHFTVFTGTVFSFADQIIISTFFGLKFLGIYIVSLGFASVFSVFTSPLTTFVPQIAREDYERNKASNLIAISALYASLALIAHWPGIPVLTFIVERFLGNEYTDVPEFFYPICLGFLVSSYNDILRGYLIHSNSTRVLYHERLLHLSSLILIVIALAISNSTNLAKAFLLVSQVPSTILLLIVVLYRFRIGQSLHSD